MGKTKRKAVTASGPGMEHAALEEKLPEPLAGYTFVAKVPEFNFVVYFSNILCRYHEMVGHGEHTSSRRLAKRLLDQEVKHLDPNVVDGIEVLTYSVRNLLKEGRLTKSLFNGFSTTDEERQEDFGFGNQHIDAKFESLSQAVIRLADTGRCERNVLREGEETLQRLIQGMLELEWEYKRQIAPAEAAKQALWDDEIRQAFGKNPQVSVNPQSPLFPVGEQEIMDAVSPNQLDAAQADALFMYQACRYNRTALGVILDGLKEINRALDRDDPTPSSRSPFR